MILPALYHWSPADRHESISRTGLQPGSPSCTAGGELTYVCLSPTPSSAWGLSGDMEWMSEVDAWDLWQVRLKDGDEVHIRSDFGPVIREVKVHTAIPPDRVWWVARRVHPASLERPTMPECARCDTEGRTLIHVTPDTEETE